MLYILAKRILLKCCIKNGPIIDSASMLLKNALQQLGMCFMSRPAGCLQRYFIMLILFFFQPGCVLMRINCMILTGMYGVLI